MCTDNIHSSKPRGATGLCRLVCSYFFCLFAGGLITMVIFPYHMFFFPLLREACLRKEASWTYYYWCMATLLFGETMVYGNFLLAIFTCPGYVEHEPWAYPPVYKGHIKSENHNEVYETDLQGKLRFCAKCDQYKPDHAHHCSMCKHCIYRKDHHCPWINNCVGRDNMKYFFLFLGYIPPGAIFITLSILYSLICHFRWIDVNNNDDDAMTMIILLGSSAFAALMSLAFFLFGMNFFCLSCKGQTSVSHMLSELRGEDRSRRNYGGLARERYLYDVFGLDRRWWKIILPFPPLRYPKNRRNNIAGLAIKSVITTPALHFSDNDVQQISSKESSGNNGVNNDSNEAVV